MQYQSTDWRSRPGGPATNSRARSGTLPGDTGWVVRGEFGHAFSFPIESGGVTLTPYAFAATGERIYINPTILENGDIHASSYGAGMRANLAAWSQTMPDGYGFVEWSHCSVSVPTLAGERIFAGILVRY